MAAIFKWYYSSLIVKLDQDFAPKNQYANNVELDPYVWSLSHSYNSLIYKRTFLSLSPDKRKLPASLPTIKCSYFVGHICVVKL